MDKSEFQRGENVTIRLSLKNIDNKTIALSWADFCPYDDKVMYFDFYITDVNGTKVFQWSKVYGRFPMLWEETLNPGEELVSVYPWYKKLAIQIVLRFQRAVTR